MRNKLLPSAAALLTLVFALEARGADECGSCQMKVEAKKKLTDSEAEYTDLLRRNKEFLAKIGPSDNSKLIKLNSNIELINIKLEGIQKNIASLDAELSQEECAPCVPKESGEAAPVNKPAPEPAAPAPVKKKGKKNEVKKANE